MLISQFLPSRSAGILFPVRFASYMEGMAALDDAPAAIVGFIDKVRSGVPVPEAEAVRVVEAIDTHMRRVASWADESDLEQMQNAVRWIETTASHPQHAWQGY